MAHFNHPRELTEVAIQGLDRLNRSGIMIVNQTPLIRGVNDDPEVLGELFNKLSFIGVPPYYVFICRPTLGNSTYAVPVEEAFEIFTRARLQSSGLAKRARLIMSHKEGKIEVLGLTEMHALFKFYRAPGLEDYPWIQIFKRNPEAYWFEDYTEQVDEYEWADDEELDDYSD